MDLYAVKIGCALGFGLQSTGGLPAMKDRRAAKWRVLPLFRVDNSGVLEAGDARYTRDDPVRRVPERARALMGAMQVPGPFLAYTHGDPCPDNVLRVNGGVRLIDFDTSVFRHALTVGVYGHIHFLSRGCVNRVPARLPVEMERVYRAELVQGCSEAANEARFYRAAVDACAY